MKIVSLTVERLVKTISDPLLDLDAMTIGVFDGLHLGHKYLIQRMLALRQLKPAAVVTFSEHPRAILRGAAPERILDPRIRNRILSEWGVDWLVVLETNRDLLSLEAEEFLNAILGLLKTRHLVVGPNFVFGRGRKGNIDFLRSRLGERLIVVDQKVVAETPASATAIRERLAAGDLRAAASLLGRPYTVLGRSRSGDGIGRTLGSPTINLDPVPTAIPPGIYAAKTALGPAAVHIGPRPTLDKNDPRFEVFLFDAKIDRVPDELEVELIERIRDIRRFDSTDELKAEIARDVEATRILLGAGTS